MNTALCLSAIIALVAGSPHLHLHHATTRPAPPPQPPKSAVAPAVIEKLGGLAGGQCVRKLPLKLPVSPLLAALVTTPPPRVVTIQKTMNIQLPQHQPHPGLQGLLDHLHHRSTTPPPRANEFRPVVILQNTNKVTEPIVKPAVAQIPAPPAAIPVAPAPVVGPAPVLVVP